MKRARKPRTPTTMLDKKMYVEQALVLRRHWGLNWRKTASQLGITHEKLVKWIKEKDKINDYVANNADSANRTTIMKKADPIRSIMEQTLVSLIEHHAKFCPLKREEIQHEARQMVYNIELQFYDEDSSKVSDFRASMAWFRKFCERQNLKNVPIYTEYEIVNHQKVSTFVEEFQNIASQYNPNLIFHFDECGLIWNVDNSPNSSQQTKNNVTLLLGSNSTGIDKLPPLLISSSESDDSLEDVDCSVDNLGVILTCSKDAMMTRELFNEWFTTHFVPHVERIAAREKIEAKALLVLNNAPVHHQRLFHPDCPFIRVLIMPPNTSIVLQPLNKDVIMFFKVLYANYLANLVENEPRSDGKNEIPLSDSLHKSVTFRDAIYLISEAWSQVPRLTLYKGWSKLFPSLKLVYKNNKPSIKKAHFNIENIPVEFQPLIADVEPQSVIDYYTLASKDLNFIDGQLKKTNYAYGDFDNPDHLDYCTRKYKSPTVVHIMPMIEQNDENEVTSSSSPNQLADSAPVDEITVIAQKEAQKFFVNSDHIDYTGNYKVPIVTTIEHNEWATSSLNQIIDLKAIFRNEDSDSEEECPRKRKLLKIANYIVKELEKPCDHFSSCCGGTGKKCT